MHMSVIAAFNIFPPVVFFQIKNFWGEILRVEARYTPLVELYGFQDYF